MPGQQPPSTVPPIPQTPATVPSGTSSTTQSAATVQPQPTLNTSSSSGSSSSPKIEKLTEGNWIAWKIRMAAILRRKDAYEIATGVAQRPQDPVADANWKDKDAIAQELITTQIDDRQVVHILDCVTSAQMWNTLRTIHEPQSFISTKRALYRCHATDGADIREYLNQMKILRDRLALTSYRIEDNEFKELLVANLPQSWESFTTSYQAGMQGDKNAQAMTVYELCSLLLEENQCHNDKEDGSEFTYTSTGEGTSRNSTRPCWICHRANHDTAHCRFSGKPKCGHCGKPGHREDECWKANRGKGRISKHKERQRQPNRKGKDRVN